MGNQKRLVFCTFGSFGDLHPHIAMALCAQKLGYPCAIASSAGYGDKIRKLGIPFILMRPDLQGILTNPDLVQRILDEKKGPKTIFREIVFPSLKNSFEDLNHAVRDGDILVSHALCMSARLVAELRGISWASSVLQPLGFLSAFDPPVIPDAFWLQRFEKLGPRFFRLVFALAKAAVARWSKPWHDLRRELGLKPVHDNPMFGGQHSSSLVLALFSQCFAKPQDDWPRQTVITGFPFFDQDGDSELSPQLNGFLNSGPAPLVFTLGSSAVHAPGQFYEVSASAARRLGLRAVFLVGRDASLSFETESPDFITVDYAPYSKLFPRALAVVHQGGIGTTAQTLLAARPSLVVPYANDQPDNARRIKRMGAGLAIARKTYEEATAMAALKRLAEESSFAEQSARAAELMGQENGALSAVDAILRTFTPYQL